MKNRKNKVPCTTTSGFCSELSLLFKGSSSPGARNPLIMTKEKKIIKYKINKNEYFPLCFPLSLKIQNTFK